MTYSSDSGRWTGGAHRLHHGVWSMPEHVKLLENILVPVYPSRTRVMRVPLGGPLLEFGFYWADISETTAVACLVATLLEHHAVWVGGTCRVCTPDGLVHSRELAGFSEVENCLTSPAWQMACGTCRRTWQQRAAHRQLRRALSQRGTHQH